MLVGVIILLCLVGVIILSDKKQRCRPHALIWAYHYPHTSASTISSVSFSNMRHVLSYLILSCLLCIGLLLSLRYTYGTSYLWIMPQNGLLLCFVFIFSIHTLPSQNAYIWDRGLLSFPHPSFCGQLSSLPSLSLHNENKILWKKSWSNVLLSLIMYFTKKSF